MLLDVSVDRLDVGIPDGVLVMLQDIGPADQPGAQVSPTPPMRTDLVDEPIDGVNRIAHPVRARRATRGASGQHDVGHAPDDTARI